VISNRFPAKSGSVVHGQLSVELVLLGNVTAQLVDQRFDFAMLDFSKVALQLYAKPSATEAQTELCLKMLCKPTHDEARYARVWDEVFARKDAYEMSP
jgi:acyl-CoA dehydrogenase